ncbi:recombinase family protein [Rhodococcoides kroppenstedtii]|uniref:recombinase family protein n=1 Tax=Rhodococcoides kroppenstedtii TaxID=293050 RepID=UPI003630F5A3
MHAIASELEAKGARLAYDGSTHDPADPAGKLFFTILGAMAEFEADLIRARTRGGVAIAKAEGRMLGRTPKLSALQRRRLLADY